MKFSGPLQQEHRSAGTDKENLCARTNFCVLITIGLRFTCRIAKLETRAFYFTYDNAMNKYNQM